LIDATAPDVALPVVRMPKLDGLELRRRLRAEGYSLRVLLISGYEDGAIAHEAITQYEHSHWCGHQKFLRESPRRRCC
jgi:YesN/AraC family two-component response regulator